MKRKRGNKKGKPPKPRPSSTASPPPPLADDDDALVVNLDNSDEDEDDSGGGGEGEGESGGVSPMEVDPPAPTEKENPSVSSEKKLSLVKVKLKTPKPPSETAAAESPINPNNNTNNNININNNNIGNDVDDDKDGNRKDEKAASEDRRFGSIKIKTYTSSRAKLLAFKDKEKDNVGGGKEEPKTTLATPPKPRYDKQELDSALTIINKVMKMEAAEPFNVPVNPEALGIPDYFDIINTPMDFGTICSNLEKGDKYMSSEDVYKDVQYIWNNCYKYNSKGDYILDLMRRVKKNFMKYWMAAGLYTDQMRGSGGAEGVPGEDVAASNLANAKAKKTKKRKRHKNDCLCAICVLKRRRREREEKERLARGQAGVIDDKLAQESKQEESSLMESPDGEDSSSNMGESQDPDVDVEVEGKAQVEKVEATEKQSRPLEDNREEELEGENVDEEDDEENETETQREEKVETSEQYQFAEKLGEESSQKLQHGIADDEGGKIWTQTEKTRVLMQIEERVPDQSIKHKESLDRAQRAKLFEHFHAESSMLLGLCESLFPRNRKSVWSGPRSLVPHQGSTHRSSIQEAIETLMK